MTEKTCLFSDDLFPKRKIVWDKIFSSLDLGEEEKLVDCLLLDAVNEDEDNLFINFYINWNDASNNYSQTKRNSLKSKVENHFNKKVIIKITGFGHICGATIKSDQEIL